MPVRTVLLACLFLAAPALARADLFVVPLPGAAGLYSAGPAPATTVRTATFHLPGPPALIRGVSLHVTGTTEVGTIACDEIPGPLAWPTAVSGQMLVAPQGGWIVYGPMPTTAGAFDWTAPFLSFQTGPGTVGWTFLSTGTGQVTINGGPSSFVLTCGPSSPPPTVTITGAWLVVDADIPVPARGASWGRLKAVYR